MDGINFPDLIRRKQAGEELTEADIKAFVSGVASGQMADSQIGAMLMAIYFKDLSDFETTMLTREMMNSGETMDWPEEWTGLLVDKHSTGGVGDKVSLVLAPALAAVGLKVPMISGRGLAHTGGTLDKLESMEGFNVNISKERMKQILGSVGCFIAGQTNNICPVDKKTYSIRDVTSTVTHLGLVTASIMSKKLAENVSALVLDVKTGSGALMSNIRDARKLAKSMVRSGKGLNVKTVALLTDMDSPLGNKVGNALEVAESVESLQGKGPSDLMNLVYSLGGHLLVAGGQAETLEEGIAVVTRKIEDGSALEKFSQMIQAQGVDPKYAKDLCNPNKDIWTTLRPSKFHTEYKCGQGGYISRVDPMAVAHAVHKLGGGRNVPDQAIDLAVGLELLVDIGQQVNQGDSWVRVHHNKTITPEVEKLLEETLGFSETPIPPRVNRVKEIVQ